MVYAPPKRKFSVDDYYRMADAGIFHEDDRVELLDGEIYEMTPIGDGHAGTVNWLSSVFVRRLGDRVVVSPQNPVRLSDYSEPQPDVAVLRRREDFYRSGKPRPADVFLIVEVAKSSLDYDRLTKLPRYADAGIPEVWIVNLADDQLEVYRKPGEGGFGERIVLVRGDSIAPEALPDLVLRVDEILG
jgi:Uma2 family endonuclease